MALTDTADTHFAFLIRRLGVLYRESLHYSAVDFAFVICVEDVRSVGHHSLGAPSLHRRDLIPNR
jgi:hypothetical protein